ncbi:MAG TPA: SDR family oxidoreductase [Puia sp.]|jgi:NAD(P)-dependent dehydrogenase (short-subunit alcohol dehydrogenase family)|nr:SDR family oxidoreductase [Puia sp.]
MQDQFRNKVVVITGASGGVGRATAHAFAREGAKIALLARSGEQLAATQREVEDLGGIGLAILTDVADPAQVEAAAERTEQELGPIDIWVNNAMASVFAPIREISAEEYRRVTEVTYLGQVYGTMAALRRMLPRNRGSIILVGSALAYRGIPLQSAYCGAKHGIEGFYDSLRCELLHDHSAIKTCMVQLPATNTTQFGWVLSRLPREPKPMGKIYEPEVAASAILYAARHNRRSIWVGSSTYKAIIGNKVAPSYADHELARTGFKGQQTADPTPPDRENNLWQPVPGDRGTYGGFANQSSRRSLTLWAAMHRGLLMAAGGILALSAAALFAKRDRK